jgi:small-conductance mechanosensitive channel
MATFLTWIEQAIFLSPENQQKLLLSLMWLVIIWVFYRFLIRIFVARIDAARTRYLWQKNSTYFFYFLLLLVFGRIWLQGGLDAFSTYLGLLSAGLAIAMKDPIANFFGWVLILWRRPFSVGERIWASALKLVILPATWLISMCLNFQFWRLAIGLTRIKAPGE